MNGQGVPLKLSGQQRAVYEALIEKDEKLASMYRGALTVLSKTDNPDRLAQSSHSLRELMEKIPDIVDVKTKAHRETLKSKVRELEDCWLGALEKTTCRNERTWGGEIDGPLSKLLERIRTFFEWFVRHHPRRKKEIAATLRELDDSGRSLPVPLEERNIETWNKIREFFVGVAHHRKYAATQEELIQWVDALERFLLDRLRPRTFADLETIDDIIRAGERNA